MNWSRQGLVEVWLGVVCLSVGLSRRRKGGEGCVTAVSTFGFGKAIRAYQLRESLRFCLSPGDDGDEFLRNYIINRANRRVVVTTVP